VTDRSAYSVLLIGEGQLADVTTRALETSGATVNRLREPDDSEIRQALEERVDDVTSHPAFREGAKTVAEFPYGFVGRTAGKSKMNLAEVVERKVDVLVTYSTPGALAAK
jgi:hypothetical protein